MIKENDYIVRIWPSGNITMGKAITSPLKIGELMFYSLETYSNEGGVIKDDIYGYIDNIGSSTKYKHRLATPIEISLFNKRGYLGIPESEIITLYRDEILNELTNNMEKEITGHICPYCGHIEMQINNHFWHIEIEHPGKPLI